MTPFYKREFSTENKHEILGESDKTLIQQMYGKAKTVEVRAVFNSKTAKVTIRKIVKKSKPEKVKIVFTLRYFLKNCVCQFSLRMTYCNNFQKCKMITA